MQQGRKGRGALTNPDCRFDSVQHQEYDDGWGPGDTEAPVLKTTVTVDDTRRIISTNQSPDLPFDQSINPYRGCEHGCIYCYARPSHAYLGFSPGLDFESRLLAKPNAAQLLKKELKRKNYRCRTIAMGTNTDPYQPIERKLQITREVLEVLLSFHHPVSIVTKSSLVERDLDILIEMAKRQLVVVMISISTYERELARCLEPRAAAPQRRLETLRRLSEAGVPTGVLVAPVIPVLTDTEIESILCLCAEAGTTMAGSRS